MSKTKLKLKNLSDYKFDFFKIKLSFKRFSHIINNPNMYIQTIKFVEQYTDKKCRDILLNDKLFYYNLLKKYKYLINKNEKIPININLSFTTKDLIKNIDTNYLFISNSFNSIIQNNNLKIPFDVIIRYNENHKDTPLISLYNLRYVKNIYGEFKNKKINFNDLEKYKKKFKVVAIDSLDSFKIKYYFRIGLNILNFSHYLVNIYISLFSLDIGGNFYFAIDKGFLNNGLKKLLMLLTTLFNNYNFINTELNNIHIFLEFTNFKGIDDKLLEKMRLMALESFEYQYSLCDIINFKYDYDIKHPNNQLFYNLTKIKGVEPSKKIKELKVIDDISLKVKTTQKSEMFINQLENIINNYFDEINYLILQYTSINPDTNEIEISKDYIKKVQYDKLIESIRFMNENKIPYNKTDLVYINQYNKNIVDSLFGFRENIHFHLVKFLKEKKSIKKKSKSKSKLSSKKSNQIRKKKSILKSNQILSGLGNYKEYHYDDFDQMQDANIITNKSKKIPYSEAIKKNIFKESVKKVNRVTEGFTRGVAAYVLKNYKLPNKTSNGYMKLWEIYNTISNLMPNKQHVKVFHLAEAPGQWINCTRHYLETKKRKVEAYDWVANSLNHKHPTNIKKYGKKIFSDDYGFIKKHPDRWLYGADNTGDITKSKNVEWFHEYMKKWQQDDGKRLDLITGDAGMNSSDNIKLVDLQKIEFAQIAMVAACASKGTNCVIKHFLNFINTYPNSYYGTGYLVSHLYLYYLMFEEIRLIKPHTSNPNSREYYVVGLRFIGLDDKNLKKIIKQLDNYQENHCLFKKEDIPESFYKQVVRFSDTIFKVNNEQYELQTMLMTCIVNPDPVILKATNCHKYLSQDFFNKIHEKRCKEWIKTYRFE